MLKGSAFIFALSLSTLFSQGQVRDLSYYLDQGFSNNPSLHDYRNQVLINHADSQLLEAKQKPYLEGIGQLMYAPVFGTVGYDEAITNGALFQTQVRISQPILNRKIKESEYNRIGIQGKTLQNSAALAAMQLKHDITGQYILACADFDILQFNKETEKLLQAEQAMLRQLVDKGFQSQAAYMSFLLELQGLERQVKETAIQYNKDIYTLNASCGIMDTSIISLSSPSIQTETGFKTGENPFLQQFYFDSLRIANSKILMENHYRPSINWVADAGILSSQYTTIAKNMGFSFGLNLGIPIFDWHQKKIQSEQIAIEEDTRLHYKNYFFFQHQQDLSRLRNELKEIEESIKLFTQQKNLTDQMVQSAHQMLDVGTMPITDYLLMIRNYRELGSSLNQARYRKLQLINELNYFHW
jgi:outer membrane protein TolC